MTNILILVNLVFLIGAAAWITYYIRKKSLFITRTVISSSADTMNRAWTTRTLDTYLDPHIIVPIPNPWTLDSSAIARLCSLLEKERPTTVVELGSGLSTVIIASIIKKYGGRLISIDHDDKFGDLTRTYLAVNGLEEVVDLRIAPLVVFSNKVGDIWYDTKLLEGIINIDLLVVDGPPSTFGPMIRRHALTHFSPCLSSESHIFLDDADREGERTIIEEWRSKYPINQVSIFGYPKSHAIISF